MGPSLLPDPHIHGLCQGQAQGCLSHFKSSRYENVPLAPGEPGEGGAGVLSGGQRLLELTFQVAQWGREGEPRKPDGCVSASGGGVTLGPSWPPGPLEETQAPSSPSGNFRQGQSWWCLGRGEPGWSQQEALGMVTRHGSQPFRRDGLCVSPVRGQGCSPQACGPGSRQADGGGRAPLLGICLRTRVRALRPPGRASSGSSGAGSGQGTLPRVLRGSHPNRHPHGDMADGCTRAPTHDPKLQLWPG